jgi:hypothetical protein
MKLGQTAGTAAAAYNSYEWPTVTGTVGQQLTIKTVGGVTTLEWGDPDQIPWTAKGQLVVGTGLATQTILNVGADGSILIADSAQPSGLNYTSNFVATTGPTGAANIPAGAVGARPIAPVTGQFRFNTGSLAMEFWNGVAWYSIPASVSGLFVDKTTTTGSAVLPGGTTLQRDAAPVAGFTRFNTTTSLLEFWDGFAWQSVSSSTTGSFIAKTVPGGALSASAVIPSGTTAQQEIPAVGGYLRYNTTENFLEFYNGATSTWELVAPAGGGVHSFVQPQPAPVQYNTGDLWYDCTTGYFKVYQNCVAPNGWTNVAEPGLPILVGNTSASPAFTGGSGTSGTPYTCSVTTTGPGTSVFIVNTVTVTGLAPYQYVPIVDLNAVTNGGRFSFSNQYANAAGVLVFQTIFIDQPVSASGSSYTASIRVGYSSAYIQAVLNIASPLTVTAGTISGTPSAGSVLTYASGSGSGGTAPYFYSWVWKKTSDNSILQNNGATYTIPGSLIGDNVYVAITVTDFTTATANNQTTDYPVPPVTISGATFPTLALSPASGPTAAPASVNSGTLKGTATGSWSDPSTSITVVGDIQITIAGGAAQGPGGPYSITNGQTIGVIWNPASVAAANDGATLLGSITNGTYTNIYSMIVDRSPSSYDFADLTSQALSTAVTSAAVTPTGFNVPVGFYYTAGAPSLTSVVASISTGAFVSAPTSLPGLTINPGDSIQLKGTTGGALSTGYSVTTTLGSSTGTPATDSWTATTTGAAASVSTPSIQTPTNGATGLSTSLSVVGNAYSSANGAGPHASSNWRIYKANPIPGTTSPITEVVGPTTWSSFFTMPPGIVNVFGSPPFSGSGCYISNGNTSNFDPTPPIPLTNSSIKSDMSAGPGGSDYYSTFGGVTSPDGNFGNGNGMTVLTNITGSLGGGNVYSTSVTLGGGGGNQYWFCSIIIDDIKLIDGQVRLRFADSTNLSNLSIGQTVTMTGGGATATVAAISSTANLISVTPISGTWVVGGTLSGPSFPSSFPPAPTAYPPGANYTSVVDVTGSANLTSYPLTGLSAASLYYAQVAYTSGTIATTSSYSSWSSFKTA